MTGDFYYNSDLSFVYRRILVDGVPVLVSISRRRRFVDRDAYEEYRRRRRYAIARSVLEFMVVRYGLRYHWVLTIKDADTDYRRAMDRLRAYVLRRGGRAIWVKELQKRGVTHFHLLTDLWVDHQKLWSIWRIGFVWVRRIHDPRYLLKYLSKQGFSFRKAWGVWGVKLQKESWYITEGQFLELVDTVFMDACTIGYRLLVGDGFLLAWFDEGYYVTIQNGFGHLLYVDDFL